MLPTQKNIDTALELYNKLQNWRLADETIRKYVEADHKENKDISIITTKVVLINSLYYTFVLSPLEMAKHIQKIAEKKQLDYLISTGDPMAVELISQAKISKRKIRFLSFASKYCHFHNPSKYSMFDKYVCNLLKKINGKEQTLGINNKNLTKYPVFHAAIVNLKEKVNLKNDFIEMDRYLWLCGQKISTDWKRLNREVRECFANNKDLVTKLGCEQ